MTDPITQPAIDPAAPAPARGRDITGWAVLILGAGGALWGFLAAFGSGMGLWDFRVGIQQLMFSVIAAIIGVLLAIVLIVIAKRKGGSLKRPILWVGLIASLLYSGYMLSVAAKGMAVPAIHDVSTDLANPPMFATLSLRADNWDAIPGGDDSQYAGLTPQQRWIQIHQQAYPDVRSVRVNKPVATVIADAERLAEARGWDVAAVDPAAGRLEATETVSLFRFKDDVVLRVRSADNGRGSIIDMRSVSRVGQSDLGVNAARVRSFLADLSGTTTAATR